MTRKLIIRGEQFITFGDAAACYGVEITWVEEIYEVGLLGEAETTDAGPAIPATLLDRLATIRRFQLQQGIELSAIALLLDALDR